MQFRLNHGWLHGKYWKYKGCPRVTFANHENDRFILIIYGRRNRWVDYIVEMVGQIDRSEMKINFIKSYFSTLIYYYVRFVLWSHIASENCATNGRTDFALPSMNACNEQTNNKPKKKHLCNVMHCMCVSMNDRITATRSWHEPKTTTIIWNSSLTVCSSFGTIRKKMNK